MDSINSPDLDISATPDAASDLGSGRPKSEDPSLPTPQSRTERYLTRYPRLFASSVAKSNQIDTAAFTKDGKVVVFLFDKDTKTVSELPMYASDYQEISMKYYPVDREYIDSTMGLERLTATRLDDYPISSASHNPLSGMEAEVSKEVKEAGEAEMEESSNTLISRDTRTIIPFFGAKPRDIITTRWSSTDPLSSARQSRVNHRVVTSAIYPEREEAFIYLKQKNMEEEPNRIRVSLTTYQIAKNHLNIQHEYESRVSVKGAADEICDSWIRDVARSLKTSEREEDD